MSGVSLQRIQNVCVAAFSGALTGRLFLVNSIFYLWHRLHTHQLVNIHINTEQTTAAHAHCAQRSVMAVVRFLSDQCEPTTELPAALTKGMPSFSFCSCLTFG